MNLWWWFRQHFTRDYNYRLSCVCLNSLSTKYRSYLLKLISTYGHFLTVNNRRYGRCYEKNNTTVYVPWILHSSRSKFSKIVWKCFLQVFKGFKYYVFKSILHFWWISSHFSLSSPLNSECRFMLIILLFVVGESAKINFVKLENPAVFW